MTKIDDYLKKYEKHACLCDGKHVCLKCQKAEQDWYEEEEENGAE